MRFKILLTMAVCALVYTATAQDKQIGDVRYVEITDDFEGTTKGMVTLQDKKDDGTLVLDCAHGHLGFVLNMETYMAGTGAELNFGPYVEARWRFDDLPPEPDPETLGGHPYAPWPLSGNHRAASLMVVFAPWDFIGGMKNSERLRIEVKDPADDERKLFDFSLLGLNEALELLPCEHTMEWPKELW